MELLRPCPFCGSLEPMTVEIDSGAWAVTCGRCAAIGPVHPNPQAAERRWNNDWSPSAVDCGRKRWIGAEY